jgi:formate hydrogenlyase subunit 3/multisubunit Na+/H+ antiporter MnhD subunit
MFGIFLFKTVILLSPLLFFLPVRWKAYGGIAIQLLLGVITTSWAFSAWDAGQPVTIDLLIPFWGGSPVLMIDRLSAFFILLINMVSLTGAWYGAGYLIPYHPSKSAMAMSLHAWALVLLQASMLHVVMVREGFAFLMAWEVMSMSSFILVIFDGEDEGNLSTGIKYLIQMHAGFTFLLLGFLWVSQETGLFGFAGLEIYFAQHSNWVLFLVMFFGFGIKAGFIPLHTWLPHAHPAAPSSVSGIMSGVMIKMGLYGILRVLMSVQSDYLTIGLIILTVSLITGIVGILYAVMQHDLKKLLAYSSIENIGIIGIGIGIAVLGQYYKNPSLSALAMAGALLHIVNHGLYKSMLFFTAGNVYYATHTRDMNKLGGLMKTMPISGGLFLIGAMSISAIPPFNGFISEFLIYAGIFTHIGSASFGESMIFLAVILTMVIVGGLSVYAFTKAFGLSFLGSSRSNLHAVEVPLGMRLPIFVSAAGILVVLLFSPWIIEQISLILPLFGHAAMQPSMITPMAPSFINISLINVILVGAIVGVFLLRRFLQRNAPAYGPTWGCGYSAGDARHQYTSTSYSEYLAELSGPVVPTQREYTPIAESEIFPVARSFKTVSKDIIEEEIVKKPVRKVIDRMALIGWAQTGKINHYLIYPLFFLLIIVLLTRFGIL